MGQTVILDPKDRDILYEKDNEDTQENEKTVR